MHPLLNKTLSIFRLLLWICALPLSLLAGPIFFVAAIGAAIVFNKNILGQGGFLLSLIMPALLVVSKIQETTQYLIDPDNHTNAGYYSPKQIEKRSQRNQMKFAAELENMTRNMDSESLRQFNLSRELKKCISQSGENAVSKIVHLIKSGANPNTRLSSHPKDTAMHSLVHHWITGSFPKDHRNYDGADQKNALLKAMFDVMGPKDIAESCLLTMDPRVFIFARKAGLDLAAHNLDDIALHFESMQRQPEFILELLDAGVVPKSSCKGLNALHLLQAAFKDGYPSMARKDVSLFGYPPDSEARLLAFDALRPLMPAGSINERESQNGFTPLHFAVASRLPGLIDRCLDAGADPLIENNFKQNPSEYGKGLETTKWDSDNLIRAMRSLDALTEAALIARASEQGKSSPPKRL